MALSIVLDTNVIVAALRSNRGASHRLLRLVGADRFTIHVSVPLVLEYESAAKRLVGTVPLTHEDIDDVVDYLCATASQTRVFYLWRPFLRDPADDMVLELAVAAGASRIITFNKADFRGAGRFGVVVQTPAEFLGEIGELP
jgi:putative PIN family toxin of toxin-antitoxin system